MASTKIIIETKKLENKKINCARTI